MKTEQPLPRDDSASVLEASRGAIGTAMQWEVLAYFAVLNIAAGLGSPAGIPTAMDETAPDERGWCTCALQIDSLK